ncbi:MAG: hypothetical protein R3200_05820 [Xanthomonadales bacterium]|nr:hypothetical protein [Xanthomonadales bacterium]
MTESDDWQAGLCRVLWLGGCLLASAGLAGAGETRFVGYAYSPDSDELVYSEIHRERLGESGQTILLTEYRDPNGVVFATREVRFEGLDPTPTFELSDRRIDYVEGAVDQGEKLLVYKVVKGHRQEETLTPGQRPLVVDAGFDRFIQREWEVLQSEAFVRLDFVSCDRLSLVALRASKHAARETQYGTVSDFRLEPNNWFFRLLVDSIRITYRDEDRQLLEYEGISNIRGADGRSLVVRIFFPPEERQTLPAVAMAEETVSAD